LEQQFFRMLLTLRYSRQSAISCVNVDSRSQHSLRGEMMTKLNRALACGVALGALLTAAGGARATDFIVPAGIPRLGVLIPGPGDTLLIETGGSIVGNGPGVTMNNVDQIVTNNGLITPSGVGGHGILSLEGNVQISNIGDITISGNDAYGISSLGAFAQITNSGDITTSGEKGYGIYSEGEFAKITNSGGITTSWVRGYGILSEGPNAWISNSGDVTTSALQAHGIFSQEAFAQITNSGDIATLGTEASGILSFGDDAQISNSGNITRSGILGTGIASNGARAQITNSGNLVMEGGSNNGINSGGVDAQITNSGVIRTTAAGSFGIYAGDLNATVTNSGTIISESTYALYFRASDATLNLLSGSAIQGGIRFDVIGSAALNISPGLNTALTFEGVPETINAHGAPVAVQGSLVAVVDPTGFSAQGEMLTDLTRVIAGAVDGRLNAARFGYVPVSGSVTAYVEPDAPVGAQAMDFGYGTGAASGFWAAGLGAYRDQDADGADVGFDSNLGGLLIGFDGEVSGGTRVGAFLGASTSNFETDANSQEIDADSYFGGLYASFTDTTHFLDLAVTGGLSDQSSDRTIVNNLVVGGVEHARADYDGFFVSPSATIGTSFAMASGGLLIPSLRARYAGLFLDSYDETGSAADLSVDDRDVNVFDFRAQLAYALAARPVNGGALHTAFRVGADATFADNSVETALLGTALNFDVSGDDTMRGFGAVDLSYLTASGSSFFLGAEAGYDSGDAFTLDVRGGLAVPL
jgi:uncharacterized protein with beta-barrel porin domain